jgi:hypothetical protein
MQKWVAIAACIVLAGCSHFSKKPVVGMVEFYTSLTRFSTLTGIYHQDMCANRTSDAHVHLGNSEMRSILAMADKTGFYRVPADLTTDWSDFGGKPPHCATFRLHIESGGMHNEVRWDCRRNGSNEPPVAVEPLVLQIQKILQSKPEVRALPWSSCRVR